MALTLSHVVKQHLAIFQSYSLSYEKESVMTLEMRIQVLMMPQPTVAGSAL